MKPFVFLILATGLAQADNVTGTWTSRVASDYVGSTGGHTGWPSWQSSVKLTFGEGDLSPFIGAWWSVGPGAYGKEVDLYAGVTQRLGRGRWTATTYWYDFRPVGREGQGDAVELKGEYTYALSPRTTVGTGVRWIQPIGRAPRGAPIIYGEVEHRVPVDAHWNITLKDRVSYDCGVRGGEAGFLSRAGASVACKVTSRTTLDLMLEWSWPMAAIRQRTSNLVVSGGWRQSF